MKHDLTTEVGILEWAQGTCGECSIMYTETWERMDRETAHELARAVRIARAFDELEAGKWSYNMYESVLRAAARAEVRACCALHQQGSDYHSATCDIAQDLATDEEIE